MSIDPKVLISGGGPAGLLTAILLANHGIPSTIIEKSAEADEWNSRSYSIRIKGPGTLALQAAGVWEACKEAAWELTAMHITTSEGKKMVIPCNPTMNFITRPLLIQCLESVVNESEIINIQRGVTVIGISQTSAVENDDDDEPPQLLQVKLSDGTTKSVTHVIGADGKWSAVRQSISEFKKSLRMTTEPSWGIAMTLPKVPTGWDTNAFHIYKPSTEKLPMYVLASVLSTGKVSVSIVCYTPVLELYPFLAPPDGNSMEDWAFEYSTSPNKNCVKSYLQVDTRKDIVDEHERDKQIDNMLHIEFPMFHQALSEMGGLETIRINRLASWVESIAGTEGEDNNDAIANYSAMNGRVALIGDAAHGMTASTGNGCNCAFESAVALVTAIKDISSLDKQPEQPVISIQALSNAFASYGKERPQFAIPKQLEAALANRKLN